MFNTFHLTSTMMMPADNFDIWVSNSVGEKSDRKALHGVIQYNCWSYLHYLFITYIIVLLFKLLYYLYLC